MKVLTQKNIKITSLVVLLTSLFVMNLLVFRGENIAFKFIEAILKENKYCKKVMKKHFNRNLIMSEKEEEQFHSSNNSWICEKLIDDIDEKVKDHSHISGTFRVQLIGIVT